MTNVQQDSPQSTTLAGYLNPFNVVPNFVTPIVTDGSTKYLIQRKPNETVAAFRVLDDEHAELVKETHYSQKVSIGLPSIYCFLFGEDNLLVGAADQLAFELWERLDQLHEYPAALLSVLGFIEHKLPELRVSEKVRLSAMRRIAASLSENGQDAGEKWLHFELLTKFMKNVDSAGFINYWKLLKELKNLAYKKLDIFVQVQLVRSPIGMSPKMKDSLTALGLSASAPHVDTIGTPVRLNQHNFKCLQNVVEAKNVMIVHAKVQGPIPISIQLQDQNSTRKRYIKKDAKKIVKGRYAQDYLCEFDFNFTFPDEL